MIGNLAARLADNLFVVVAAIPVLGIIIFVHELGHFIAAKLFGIHVPIFSFGFGRRLAGFKWGDTDCRLSLIPLGGYVKLEGEPDDQLSESVTPSDSEHAFINKPRWQRIVVYVAGPAMNVVLAILVMTVLFTVGYAEFSLLKARPLLGAVEAGQAAAQAGLLAGDEIVAVDGRPVASWEELTYGIAVRPNALIKIRYRRQDQEQETQVRSTTRERTGYIGIMPPISIQALIAHQPAERAGLQVDDAFLFIDAKPISSVEDVLKAIQGSGGKAIDVRVFRQGRILDILVQPVSDGGSFKIGVQPGPGRMVETRYRFDRAVVVASQRTWEMTAQVFDVLGRLITRRLSVGNMSGPLGIAQASGTYLRLGPSAYFGFIAFVSVNVGLLNLILPLVPLDGGHILLLLIEGIARRDINERVKYWIMNAGLVVVLALIVVVLYSDVSRTALFGKYLP